MKSIALITQQPPSDKDDWFIRIEDMNDYASASYVSNKLDATAYSLLNKRVMFSRTRKNDIHYIMAPASKVDIDELNIILLKAGYILRTVFESKYKIPHMPTTPVFDCEVVETKPMSRGKGGLAGQMLFKKFKGVDTTDEDSSDS